MLFCDLTNEPFDMFDHNKTLDNMPNIYSFLLPCNQDLNMVTSNEWMGNVGLGLLGGRIRQKLKITFMHQHKYTYIYSKAPRLIIDYYYDYY